MIRQEKLRGLVRFLYTHNPFYLISSGLILYGIYVAFRSEDAKVDDPWLLILSLCGYTALMAVTALLVIKLGKVWEDARSIVLILLFQFAAISMSFDELCAVSSETAFPLLLFGFVFSTLISEGVIAGLGIRFPSGPWAPAAANAVDSRCTGPSGDFDSHGRQLLLPEVPVDVPGIAGVSLVDDTDGAGRFLCLRVGARNERG